MADITPKNEVPSDHMTPPEAGSNEAPPANAQRLPPDHPEATKELTQAVNAREEQMEETVDEKHEGQARRAGVSQAEAAKTTRDTKKAREGDKG
jgi:hypothetical protein